MAIGMEKRRMIKVAIILLTLLCCSQLMYQGGIFNSYFNIDENVAQVIEVSDVTVEPVIKRSVSAEVVQEKSSPNLTLDDVFISVKTTRFHHKTRLPILISTWFQMAKKQTWFFSDKNDVKLQEQTDNHLVNTHCSPSHARRHLCCKTAVEFDHFLSSGKKWFCHFDDDNYVNVPGLVQVLRRYDYRKDWYLGRSATSKPIKFKEKHSGEIITVWYGTGGAGYCLSLSLALRILPMAGDGKFISICDKIRFPDDIAMGYIIEYLANSKFTFVPEFHSHLEQLSLIHPKNFKDQVSFGYSGNNTVSIEGFTKAYDPSRFLSLHCFLFPSYKFCPR